MAPVRGLSADAPESLGSTALPFASASSMELPQLPRSPMRILLLTTGLRLGGAEQQVAALARRFDALGHAVAVVSLTPGCEVALPPGIDTLNLAMRKSPWSMARALRQMRGFIQHWRPDVIHAHMVHANLFGRALIATGPARTMPPLVCTAHSAREGGMARMLAYRLTDRWAGLTTHVSAEGRERMITAGAVPAGRIVVLPNGIDTARFRPDGTARAETRAALGLDAATPLLLHVGRLVPEKNQALLLEAFARLPSSLASARLLIAGDGSERAALEYRIAALSLGDRVRLLGTRADIPALLNAADVFALSSDIEGMPLVVGEAMACGCPVVATDAAGVAQMVDGFGQVVPRGDADALAAALARALRDGRGDIAQQAARHSHIADSLGLEAISDQWLARYAALAAAKAHARMGTA
ncbi:glycosyl transferase family 1 [Cupriavidus gilardii CR3]|nr:glycosyl transferase family 1 [Cupriavidus gilardii CR3]